MLRLHHDYARLAMCLSERECHVIEDALNVYLASDAQGERPDADFVRSVLDCVIAARRWRHHQDRFDDI